MKITGRLLAICTLTLAGFAANAQDTAITIRDKVVLSEYMPKLAEPIKEPTPATAEAPDAPLPKLSYAIIPVQFRTVSRIDLPKAMEMGKNTVPALKNNLIRLGFGNYASPLAEVYLHNLRNEYGAYGLNFKHLSANGPDKAFFADNSVSLFGKRFFKAGTLFANFDYLRNGLRFYGFDKDQAAPSDGSLKQAYNTLAVNGGWESREFGKHKTQSITTLSYHNLSDKWGVQENDLLVGTSFKTLIKKDVLKINLEYNYNAYQDSLGKFNRNFVNINPRYNLKEDKFSLSLGFNSSIYKDTGKVKPYFFPVIDAEYEIDKGNVYAIGGISGKLQKNTMRGYITENPFMGNRNQMGNTVNRFEGYLGLKGKASPHFGFTTRVYLNRYNNMAVFIADSTVLRRFKPLYIDARVIRFNLELAYQYSEKVRMNLTGNFYNYKIFDSAQQAWQMPTAEIKLNTTYNIGNKLLFSADIFVMNKRTAISEYSTVAATSLKPFTDFNLGLDYRFRKNLSLFVRVNNISSVRYQRWYNYSVLGINALGGITFSL
jgi:hypothetical protein